MTDPGLRLARLDPGHHLDGFDSGNDSLDSWLKRHALTAQQMDTARTFLLLHPDGDLVGYFSLTMGSVLRRDAPPKLIRGLPSYPVGMVLLARLALDRRHHGSGTGGLLLSEALRKAVTAGEAAAARLVVVDAIDDDAVRFYARYGFISLPDHPRRLFRRTKDIAASLQAAAEPDAVRLRADL